MREKYKAKKLLSIILCAFLCLTFSPIVSAADNDIASGSGWKIDAKGCLHLTGAVSNFSRYDEDDNLYLDTPWVEYLSEITSIVADEGSSVDNGILLFYGCENATSIDIEKLDTSNAICLDGLAAYCSSAEGIKLNGINTSNVVSMSYMFEGCINMESIDISGLDTSNVLFVDSMFLGDAKLKNINLGKIDTSSVQYASEMFSGCSSLENVDLSGLDTSSVKSMKNMFFNCAKLKTLDLSKFNTSEVIDLGYMFYGCSSLKNLDLANFNTDKTQAIDGMFYGCSSLEKLDISGFCVDNVIYYSDMFTGCAVLSELAINENFLSITSDQLLSISNAWTNKDNFKIYDSEEALKGIEGKATLLSGCRYNVSFDMLGHGDAIESQCVKAGDKAIKPDNPAAEGFEFVAWFIDDKFEKEYDFNNPVNETTTLYAKWKEVKKDDPDKPSKKPVVMPEEKIKEQVRIIDNVIKEAAKKVAHGQVVETPTVVIDMKQEDGSVATVVPVEILNKIKGQDINVVFIMDGYSWTINGKDVNVTSPKAINLEVIIDSNAIPSDIVNKFAEGNPTKQISLKHEGDFGFTATLTINVGKEFKGQYGNLYWHDRLKGTSFMDSGLIDENGNVSLEFSHASDYFIVINNEDMSKKDGINTGDNGITNLCIYLSVLVAGVGAVAMSVTRKKTIANSK